MQLAHARAPNPSALQASGCNGTAWERVAPAPKPWIRPLLQSLDLLFTTRSLHTGSCANFLHHSLSPPSFCIFPERDNFLISSVRKRAKLGLAVCTQPTSPCKAYAWQLGEKFIFRRLRCFPVPSHILLPFIQEADALRLLLDAALDFAPLSDFTAIFWRGSRCAKCGTRAGRQRPAGEPGPGRFVPEVIACSHAVTGF